MTIRGRYGGLLYFSVLVIILPVATYTLAIRKTTNKWGKLHSMERQIEEQRNSTYQNSTQSSQQLSSIDIISNGTLIQTIAPVAQGYDVTIERFVPFITADKGNIRVVTAEVEISGSYKSIIRVVDFMEQQIREGKIVSLEFHSKKGAGHNRGIKLSATLLIQQIIETKQ